MAANKEIDMNPMPVGFCCSKNYTQEPKLKTCQFCRFDIKPNESYFNYENRLFYCAMCMKRTDGRHMYAGYRKLDSSEFRVLKTLFNKEKNNVTTPELLVACVKCGRIQHAVCELYYADMWPQGFMCQFCVHNLSTTRPPNQHTSARLPHNNLSQSIESRVRQYLQQQELTTTTVSVRVISSRDYLTKISSEVNIGLHSDDKRMEDMPYRRKGIFAFQLIDGVDVCIFGMYVQEYGSECPAPNTGKVYMSHIDQLKYFTPKASQDAICSEIILGYLSYIKQLGYISAHVWPDSRNDQIVHLFNQHPDDEWRRSGYGEAFNTSLTEWYKITLGKGVTEDIVIGYDNVLEADSRPAVLAVPYFEGDYWPGVMEDVAFGYNGDEEEESYHQSYQASEAVERIQTFLSTKEIGNVAYERLLYDYVALAVHLINITDAPETVHSIAPGAAGTVREPVEAVETIDVNQRRGFVQELQQNFNSLRPHLYRAFTIRLNSEQPEAVVGPIHDADPLVVSHIAGDAMEFKHNCGIKQLEFTSLRKAKYATMVLLYMLHTEVEDEFLYNCSWCRRDMLTRYVCEQCLGFNLCDECSAEGRHRHRLVEVTFTPKIDDFPIVDGMFTNPSQATHKRLVLESRIQYHVFFCNKYLCMCNGWGFPTVTAANCSCTLKLTGGCERCKLYISAAVYHSKNCHRQVCDMPYCSDIKLRRRLSTDTESISHLTQLDKTRASQLSTDLM